MVPPSRWPCLTVAPSYRPDQGGVLGVVEGLTEFLPVSSTGHLLLMEHFLGWGDDAFGKSFAILIQLGAILALLTIYFGRLWSLATHMFTRLGRGALHHRRAAGVPAGGGDRRAGGARFIKAHLFDVRVVCVMFIVGGFVLLLGRPAESEAALFANRPRFRCRCISASACASASPWSPACRARARPSSAPCCSAPTGARPRNFPSGWRCRPWSAPLPTRCSRAAPSLRTAISWRSPSASSSRSSSAGSW